VYEPTLCPRTAKQKRRMPYAVYRVPYTVYRVPYAVCRVPSAEANEDVITRQHIMWHDVRMSAGLLDTKYVFFL